MKELITYLIATSVSFLLSVTIIPILRKIAYKVNLTDKPNNRKVHATPIPLVGGIAITSTTFLSLLITLPPNSFMGYLYSIIIGAGILLVIGVMDDKYDIRASYKLAIQFCLAYFVYSNGIKLEGFYGLFGIYEIPEAFQFILTLVVIVGTTNAFNLTDGIDGLAAGLALIACVVFTGLALLFNIKELVVLSLAIMGSLLGFLRFNFSAKRKIFMGDAGSLVLGFVLVVLGILLIQKANSTSHITLTMGAVIGVLALPVLDSLRVYYRRIKVGNSPFKADKTHLHHLVLKLGVHHKAATSIILFIVLANIGIITVLSPFISMELGILISLLFFCFAVYLFGINETLITWKDKIKNMEQAF